MQPQIVTRPAFTVVGQQISTTPMNPRIPQLWGEFVERIDEVSAIAEPSVSYGLMGRYAENMATFDYMAGVSVARVNELPSGMTTWEVPAHTYAVFEATLATLGETFGYVYNQWLPTSDFQPVPDFCFERYPEHFDPEVPGSTMEIYIPVEEKG